MGQDNLVLEFSYLCYVETSRFQSDSIEALLALYLNLRKYLVVQASLPWGGDLGSFRATFIRLGEVWKYVRRR